MTRSTTTRLHHCLVDSLRTSRPDSPQRPITVAEIYQDLVPYRTVRSAMGVELNADYEHALLRLLAGEGGYVRLEPEEAREELQRELESPHPDVGLYRKFAGCDVWVDLNVVHPLEPLAPAGDDVWAGLGGSATPDASPVGASDPDPRRADPPATAGCLFCRATLPQDRTVRYCPFCGADQLRRPCPNCGEVLELAWRFCVGCGAGVSAGARVEGRGS